MKKKKEFMNDFFNRLSDMGFTVDCSGDSDIAAEVYTDESLFCVITKDGDIIYEAYDDNKARELTNACEQMQQAYGIVKKPPFDIAEAEQIALMSGTYFKMCESIDILMLCRPIGIFGYEYVTCMKTPTDYNTRKYYREQKFYDMKNAQSSFAMRSGFSIVTSLTDDDMRVILSALNQNIYLNNNISNGDKAELETIIAKIENTLPQYDINPRYFFEQEQEA